MIAIIPARGESKGIPRKNLQQVGGMSLIERAIRLCQAVADEVVVSSDHGEILAIAKDCDAVAWPRPKELATDESPTIEALRDVVCHYLGGYDEAGRILYYQCTAPLTTADHLRQCIDGVRGYDMACLVHPFDGYVIDNGKCVNASLSPNVPRRQDLPPQYQIARSAWCFHATYLRQPFYTGEINWVPVPGRTLDIDDADELALAKLIVDCMPHRVLDMAGAEQVRTG